MRRLPVGTPVQFTSPDQTPYQTYAAIITAVDKDYMNGEVDLVVFLPTYQIFERSVPYSHKPGPGFWNELTTATFDSKMCERCDGSGWILVPVDGSHHCPDCDGSGLI